MSPLSGGNLQKENIPTANMSVEERDDLGCITSNVSLDTSDDGLPIV